MKFYRVHLKKYIGNARFQSRGFAWFSDRQAAHLFANNEVRLAEDKGMIFQYEVTQIKFPATVKGIKEMLRTYASSAIILNGDEIK